MANRLETALIALLAKRLTNKAPGGAGGSRKATSALDKKLGIKVDLNFVAYHMWAYEISGLSLAEYVKNKPFTFGAFSDWRSRRFKHLSNCNNKAGPSKLNKKRHQFKYRLEFIATTIKLFKKSKLSQQNFANTLGIPRTTLNKFIISAHDPNHPLYNLIAL
jgi:DNA-binding transcriptional regulator YiaG